MPRKHGLFRPHLGRSFPQVASSTLRESAGYTFVNAEAVALVARFTTPPTHARKALIDTLVGSLKTAGVWSKLDCLWLKAAADSQAAQRNWIADQYNLTAVSSPTFTADRGYAGNGSTSYLTTNFTPSTAVAAKMTLNSAHLSVWSNTDSAANVTDIGVTDGATTGIRIDAKRADTNMLVRVNDLANLQGAVANSSGYFFAGRAGAALKRSRKGQAAVTDDTTASVALPGVPIFIGALNGSGTPSGFSTRQYAAASIGANLTDAESDSLQSALNTYLTAVGAA